MSHVRLVTFAVACGLLAACQGGAPVQSGPVISPQLDSGVSSNNGGGQRATGGTLGVNIGPQGATTGGAPSGAGAAY
jgi:hypothetical protein